MVHRLNLVSRSLPIRLGLVCAAMLYCLSAHATYFSTSSKLAGSDSVFGDFAGASVAVSADSQTLIFGAPNATVSGVASAGKAYVFTRNADGTWTQQAVLTEPGTPGSDDLGSSIVLSADGNTAIVGAPDATVSGQPYSGKIYVFTRTGTTWSEQTSFSAPTSAPGGGFGTDVAVSGDAQTLLVGAPLVTVNSQSHAGAVFAYIQANGTWSGPTQLTASDSAANNQFGTVALSADGNTALIGASGAGNAYFFTRSNGAWSQSQELSDPGGEGDEFGAAVALSDNGQTAVVGAYYTTIAGPPQPYGTGAGEAYIYMLANDSWSLQQDIPNPLSETGNQQGGFEGNFGNAVSLSADGNTALIGADQVGSSSGLGQAFTFARSNGTWTEIKEIDDPGQQSMDHFGGSAALNSRGDTAFVGSTAGSHAHYVYVIDSPVDLSLMLSADHSVVTPGQSFTYHLTAINNDTEVTATNVTLSNSLPTGVAATSSTGGCTGTTGTVTCVDMALAPGAQYQPTITVTAPASTGAQPFNITDTATVNAEQPDPDGSNDNASLPVIVQPSSSGGGGGSTGGGGSGGSGGGSLGLFALLGLGMMLTLSRKRK